MKRVWFSLATCMVLALGISCATTSTSENGGINYGRVPEESHMHLNPEISWIWDCTPRNGQPVFFASSGVRANRDDEKIYCLQSAAIQAAQYYSISGINEMMSKKSTVYFGQVENSEVFFSHERAREMYDKLEIVEEFQDKNGTYILATLPSENLNIDYTVQWDGKNPDWMFNIPEIPGYITAVGLVSMHRTFSNSIAQADEEAFLQLLNSLYARVESTAKEHTKSSENYSETASIVSTQISAMGNIENFYIIGRWRDKDMNYYSLAICPENQ